MSKGGSEKQVTLSLVDGLAFRATTSSGHDVTIDAAGETVGGGDAGMRPTEALLVALGACGAMDVASMLRKMREDLRSYEIRVSGVQRREHPRVYTSIRIIHSLSGDLDEANVRRAIGLSITRYCPVFAMLSPTVPITVEYELFDRAGVVTGHGVVSPGQVDSEGSV